MSVTTMATDQRGFASLRFLIDATTALDNARSDLRRAQVVNDDTERRFRIAWSRLSADKQDALVHAFGLELVDGLPVEVRRRPATNVNGHARNGSEA